MTTYERLVVRADGSSRSKVVFLENPAAVTFAGTACTTGLEVGYDGVAREFPSPEGPAERRQIIENTLITRRQPLTMNLTYARLQRADGTIEGPR